jgi:protein-tyrosine phosphatase
LSGIDIGCILGVMPHAADTPLPPPRDAAGPYRICCVCLGNICRSPMAEVVLRDQVARAGLSDRVTVDSAGTGNWHAGDRMNSRARAALRRGGYDSEAHRARQFDLSWLAERDLILAMDAANLRDLRVLARGAYDADTGGLDRRIRLFGEIAGLDGADVPDPYYGTDADFARVLAMLETGLATIVDRLRKSYFTDR